MFNESERYCSLRVLRLVPIALALIVSLRLFGQEAIEHSKEGTVNFSSFNDFTKNNYYPIVWTSIDFKKMAYEARYNYNGDKNFSLYLGPVVNYNDWNIRVLPGIVFGNSFEISFSPIVLYENEKISFYNATQINYSLTNAPSYFFQWGEVSYNLSSFLALGVSDRFYIDNGFNDFSFGPEIVFNSLDFYLYLYYWIPTNLTESRFSILFCYEKPLVFNKRVRK